MKVTLVVARGSHQGKEVEINHSPFLIGRDPQCHLRPASSAISRRHCALFVHERRLFVHDFGSTNGTIVNGQRVSEETELRTGDQIQIDRLVFDVRVDAGASAPAPVAPETTDDDAVAALLLDLQSQDQSASPQGSPDGVAEAGADTTVLSAPVGMDTTRDVPPPAKKPAPPADASTAQAAKALLSKYKKLRKSASQ